MLIFSPKEKYTRYVLRYADMPFSHEQNRGALLVFNKPAWYIKVSRCIGCMAKFSE